ncbi:MAG: EAL domain-containing protein [Acetatifactor sp.]|nr:EAL domain-containing protein [Acetatifactor sp.]
MYWSGYNVVGELISFTLAMLVLFLMMHSNPRRTRLFIFDKAGIWVSMVAIWVQIILAVYCKHPEYYQKWVFDSLCLVYLILYMVLLILLISYINLLDIKNWIYARGYLWTVGVCSVMYLAVVISLLEAGKMYEVTEGTIRFRWFMPTYLGFGIVSCMMCLIINHFGRTSLPKIVRTYIKIFVWSDFVLLILQLRHQEVIFSSLTYVLPFTIFYVMLHNNPYDGPSGCQGKDAFDAIVARHVKGAKEFVVIYISLPQLLKLDEGGITNEMEMAGLEACRKVEKLQKEIGIYRLNHATFAVFGEISKMHAQDFLIEMKKIMDEASSRAMLNYEMVALKSHPILRNTQMFKSMAVFLFGQARHGMEQSDCRLASEKDYEDFYHYYQIEQVLLDIRNKMNLDDERVLCYMQPIYSVKVSSFQSAEALMRLRMGSEIIYPKEFLEIAEKNNCIHALTCIMLNKVCKRVREIQGKFKFDAITVNCSADELSDWSLHDQLLKIINRNLVDTSKIRLELTERAMFTDYKAALHNVEKLNLAGVQLYLDDFGTGYSNLERIISCPFHTIKFDKSLLHKAVHDSSVDDLLVHMVNVFKKNGFVLLVEGVENREQSEYCIEKGFDYIQGYQYAQAVPAEQIHDYFKKR